MKRFERGLTLLEVIIVLFVNFLLFDLIFLAVDKGRDHSKEREHSLFLIQLEQRMVRYIDANQRTDLCAKLSQGNCPDLWELDKQELSRQGYLENLNNEFLKKTHILVRRELPADQTDTPYLSAMIFTDADPDQLQLNTARINLMVGYRAGALTTDGKYITNSVSDWRVPANQWTLPGLQPTQNSNFIYLPSAISKLITLDRGLPVLDSFKLTTTNKGTPSVCTSVSCEWKPIYTSDEMVLNWTGNQNTDHVKVSVLDKPNNEIYSSDVFNRKTLSIAAIDSWYGKALTVQVTPYSKNNTTHGEPWKQSITVRDPLVELPFTVKFSAWPFMVDGSNKETTDPTSYGLGWLVFPKKMQVRYNAGSVDKVIYTYVKPLTIVTSLVSEYASEKNRGIIDITTVKDTSESDYFTALADFNQYVNSSRTPVRLENRINSVDELKTRLEMQLFWGSTLVCTIDGSESILSSSSVASSVDSSADTSDCK